MSEGFKPHRFFSALFDRCSRGMEKAGFEEHRHALVGSIKGRVLEIGAGTGLNLDKYQSAEEVVALEPDPHMRRRMNDALARATVPVTVVDGAAYPLPFEDGSFDAVVFSLVLCSVPDQKRALSEAARVLAPGGRIWFLEHVRSDRGNVARWQDLIQPLWSMLGGGCHPNRDTLQAIEAAGFEMEGVERFEFKAAPLIGEISAPHIRGVARKP